MKYDFLRHRRCLSMSILLLVGGGNLLHANPTGGTVAQGSATFSTSGSQFTINQTSASALINWQSFNIAAGETTTFNQPSSSSVTWNQIGDANASQILGTLNANGYVILQNPNGFYVGGQATINAHGLVMTTASTPALNLASGGAWEFDAPPPKAQIVNYGRINITGGGSAYLIASDIENGNDVNIGIGTISAPGGNIGLYAGQTVLVSMSPDGRGLSARVTLPQGSVDNEGNLIADGGSIVAQAQMVNQNGLVQANSARNVNGTIELVASDSVNLGDNSTISANGDSTATAPSAGGSVKIQSGNSFSDQAGSIINIAGGSQGGNGGQVEISAPQIGAIASAIHGQAADGFSGGVLTIDPSDITLDSAYITTLNSEISGGLSQINLQADNNITLSANWTLADQTVPAALSLSAGNNITLNNSLSAGNNWNVNLTAGTAFVPTPSQPKPNPGSDGIYLNGSAYLQAQNGDVNLWAANEVIVNSGAIRTIGGGNIDVTTEYGNVNTGTSANGFSYLASGNGTAAKPYYTPFQTTGQGVNQHVDFTQSSLGGISTAAGGNVTINAGGDVISFPTTTVAASDAGTGAFGPEPGNVTISAGGNVYGHYVVMNGVGTINAQNIGTSVNNQNVALSLAKGSWTLNAQNDIYLQEVRNPNGVFNNTKDNGGNATAGNHLFDYDPQATVTLNAGNEVYLTGYNLPRLAEGVYGVPMLLPPTLIINAGSGGVVLQTPTAVDSSGHIVNLSDSDITLFPSAYGNLQITTTDGGGLSSDNPDGTPAKLFMSDSGQMRWSVRSGSTQPFDENDHASALAERNNPDPVIFNISGSMENVMLLVSKFAQINVGGDMIECSFYGENLHANDVTSINVGGQIYNAISFTSVTLDQVFPDVPSGDLPPNQISSLLTALKWAVNPDEIKALSTTGYTDSQLQGLYESEALLFPSFSLTDISYNPITKQLTVAGPMSGYVRNELTQGSLTFVTYNLLGIPNTADGHFVTDTITWTPANSVNYTKINQLYTESQQAPALVNNTATYSPAYIVGGPGTFDITANAISLGNCIGILSVGSADIGARDYSFLAPYTTSGATINVTVLCQQQIINKISGETGPALALPASTIAALAGGDVTVNCTGENSDGTSMDLGSQDLAPFEATIMNSTVAIALGIYTTGGGNVNVTALGTINIDTSRIAAFNGGNVFVESYTGDVDAGSGGSAFAVPVKVFSPYITINNHVYREFVFANGIVAETLLDPTKVPGAATVPGNITVTTPQGDIIATQAGIKQEALNGTAPLGPTVTLTAGTPAVPGDFNSSQPPLYVGNIDLGTAGAIGDTIIAQATGKISGLAVSQHNATLTSQSVGSLTVLAGGTANVSAQSAGSGQGITIIGGAGVNASGIGSEAILLGQNVSVNGGTAQSTLGTSATTTAASQSAAGQTSNENQQQVASSDNGNDNDKDKKKKAGLERSVGRVTVILPKTS